MGAGHETHGWVLHRRPWRESSLLVEFLSESHGRIGLVARGGRSERSPWRGLIEPFMPLNVSFVVKGEMGTLKDVEAIGDRYLLTGQALWCGLYVNELLIYLLERDEAIPHLLAHYRRLIGELMHGTGDLAGLRRFEWDLLTALGVAPSLDTDADGASPIVATCRYRLELDYGFVPTEAEHGVVISGEALQWLADLREETPACDRLREVQRMNRALIDHQLGGRQLKTRELIRSLM